MSKPRIMNATDYAKLEKLLRDPSAEKDAAIVWLCEKVAELNQRLAEIHVAVNKR